MATCPKCRAHYADDLRHCTQDGETLLPDETFAQFDAELQAGDLVGEYRVEKKIGEGGFGQVYAAVHPVIGKRAAIKVLNREYSSSKGVVSRFVSEARAVNQIRHRHIIDIFAFGTLPAGLHYFVMELLDGTTLDSYLTSHVRMAPAQALPLLRGIAKALDAAHGAGIAHRDLKPENVFLCQDEEGGVYPKLLDFGIAKLMGDNQVGHKTRTGAALGTPYYMSPEQCRGKDVDHMTDIYAFGVMTHQLLTGQLPFTADNMMDLMFKHTHEAPPPMSTVWPELPVAFDAPVLAMLAKDASARPSSVTRAIDALIAAAAGAGIDVPKPAGGISGLDTSGARSGGAVITPGVTPAITGKPAITPIESAPTLGMFPESAPAPAVPASARTINEDKPASSGNKTWLVAAAALVVGVGVTVLVTRGLRDPEPASPTPASGPSATGEAADASPSGSPSTGSIGDRVPSSEPNGDQSGRGPTSSLSAFPSGSGSTAAPRTSAVPGSTSRPVAPPSSTVKPYAPPKPDVPDDLETPWNK